MTQMSMKKDDYVGEYDIWDKEEKERLGEVKKRDAINADRSEGNEKHEEAVQVQEESQGSVLRLDQQKETRDKQVAPVRKRGRPKKGQKKKIKKTKNVSPEERQRRSQRMKEMWEKKHDKSRNNS
jgi:hypothetical protein